MRIRIYYTLIFLLLAINNGISQEKKNLQIFSLANKEQAKVLLPNDQGFLILGETIKNDKKSIVYLQLDKNGNPISVKTFSAEDPLVVVDAMATNSGYLLTAENYVQSRESLMMVHLNSNGEVLQVSTRNENGNEVEPYAMTQSKENFFVVGFTKLATLSVNSFYTYKVENQFPYVMKMDAQGNKIWSKQIELKNDKIVGDIRDIATMKDGSLILIANVYDVNTKTKSINNLLINIDDNGNINWSKSLNGKHTDFLKLKLDSQDNIYLAGKQTIDQNNIDIILSKLNASGLEIWSKKIGNEAIEIPSEIQIDDNKIYLAGSSSSLGKEKREGQGFISEFDIENGKQLRSYLISDFRFSKITSLTFERNKLYFTGAIIEENKGFKMKIIFGTPLFSANTPLQSNSYSIDFKPTEIKLLDINTDFHPKTDNYKITTSDEKIYNK